MTNPIIYSWISACVISATPAEISIEKHEVHEHLSGCHMAVTLRGFDNINQQCYCIERTEDVSTN